LTVPVPQHKCKKNTKDPDAKEELEEITNAHSVFQDQWALLPSSHHQRTTESGSFFSLAQALSDNKTFLTALLVEKESEPLLCF